MWKRYAIDVPVEGAPDKPERFEIEVYDDDVPSILAYHQVGFEVTYNEIFVDLETLVALGDLATDILAGKATPTEEGD